MLWEPTLKPVEQCENIGAHRVPGNDIVQLHQTLSNLCFLYFFFLVASYTCTVFYSHPIILASFPGVSSSPLVLQQLHHLRKYHPFSSNQEPNLRRGCGFLGIPSICGAKLQTSIVLVSIATMFHDCNHKVMCGQQHFMALVPTLQLLNSLYPPLCNVSRTPVRPFVTHGYCLRLSAHQSLILSTWTG